MTVVIYGREVLAENQASPTHILPVSIYLNACFAERALPGGSALSGLGERKLSDWAWFDAGGGALGDLKGDEWNGLCFGRSGVPSRNLSARRAITHGLAGQESVIPVGSCISQATAIEINENIAFSRSLCGRQPALYLPSQGAPTYAGTLERKCHTSLSLESGSIMDIGKPKTRCYKQIGMHQHLS
ncbi:hypothetical protein Q8A67_012978 [Cirrhinus molitorella]|uniref:Uncharacterized protein n=1 Tax=Cirrhinus molitorella TaxID=172907 RepID=A0AA88PSC1_9TELE|nr:hypothetical protein Q8A67_012978 [Cirrhinus molitorella]